MRRNLFHAMLMGMIVFAAGAGCASSQRNAPTEWEYLYVTWSDLYEVDWVQKQLEVEKVHPDDIWREYLNRVGEDGWELVAMSGDPSHQSRLTFKRAKPAEEP